MAISLTNEEILNFVSSGNFLCRNIISHWNFRIIVLYRLMPLEQNCISISNNSGRFWMNTPLKASEKQQDSQNH